MKNFKYNQILIYEDGTFSEEFKQAQDWANQNNAALIEDINKRHKIDGKLMRQFTIVKSEVLENEFVSIIPTPRELSVEELKFQKRNERMNCLGYICNDIERYNNQKAAGIPTTDTEETYMNMLFYAQYLRDFCNQDSEWWNEEIMCFDTWKEINNK